MTAPDGLARKSIGTGSLFFFGVGASAPMTVVAGAVVATYATTGVVGVPLSFLVLAVALAFFTVGYVAMSRYVPHAATFYAYLARGLGRVWGPMGAAVSLVAYNSIQICLYGLLGGSMSGLVGGEWWVWALITWAVVAVVGGLHIGVNAGVLTAVLIAEIVVIVLFDVAAFLHPHGGSVSVAPMLPGNLLVDGIGGVFAFGIACFVGYEAAPVYGEEARSHKAVARASYRSLAFLGIFYAVSSWAMAVAVGPENIPTAGLPFSTIQEYYGDAAFWIANVLLITSIFAAMLSFHNSVARYVFGLSRERVLPAVFSRVGSGSARAGAPIGGSVLQSAIALIVILTFAAAGADPVVTLFTWLAALAAIGVMLLMMVTSLAVIGFFRRGNGGGENSWQTVVAPVIGTIVMAGVLAITVANLSSLLGTEPGSPLNWLLPGIIAVAAGGGLLWGLALRAKPAVYYNIGVGEPEPLAVLERDLSRLQV